MTNHRRRESTLRALGTFLGGAQEFSNLMESGSPQRKVQPSGKGPAEAPAEKSRAIPTGAENGRNQVGGVYGKYEPFTRKAPLKDAKYSIEKWRRKFGRIRPHDSLG